MTIRAGTFRAKVTDYGVSVSEKTGDPSVWIQFTWDDDGVQTWRWTGAYTTEKSMGRVHKTVITLGMKSNELDELAQGVASGHLDTVNEYEIVVKEEEYMGKTRHNIAFVNPIGGVGFGKAMDHLSAKKLFASKNAKANMAQARAGLPKAQGVSSVKGEEVPF